MSQKIFLIACQRESQNILVIPNTRKARVRNRTKSFANKSLVGNQTSRYSATESRATNHNQA